MPRPYRLGEREARIRATRDRILDAAIDLYAEVGISAATFTEIGLRADVAPGTLRSHFPTRDALDRAMVDRLASEVDLPDASIFDGARSIEARLARLLRAGAVFSEQGRRLHRMWLREPMLTPAWLEKGDEFGSRWEMLVRATLGPLAEDEDALAVLRATIHPDFFDRLRGGVRTPEEAAALAAAALAPWFRRRSRRAARAELSQTP